MVKVLSAALVMAALAGCVAPDQPHEMAPQFTVNARWEADALVFNVTGDGECQVLLNTDNDTSTGVYNSGSDYEASDLDTRSGSLAVRRTRPADPSDSQGWGAITGWAPCHRLADSERQIVVPLSALGRCAETVRYVVSLNSDRWHYEDRRGSLTRMFAVTR